MRRWWGRWAIVMGFAGWVGNAGEQDVLPSCPGRGCESEEHEEKVEPAEVDGSPFWSAAAFYIFREGLPSFGFRA